MCHQVRFTKPAKSLRNANAYRVRPNWVSSQRVTGQAVEQT
jgi:hypothetical protein